ncbi:MAG: histidine phosphatase family protein [Flavobacteriaceae bacterium]|nr:histidine phosphatase family protein [Flavobacteriaceae bacterium]
MKSYFILFFALVFTLPSFAQNAEATAETSTFYFIRHAEKDRSDASNKNPNLTQAGVLRAAKWSLALKNVKFDAVYSTDYNRTLQTAQPTAEKNGVKITSYDPRELDGKAFLEANTGKTVLVVGHSNTTPAFVNSVLGTKKHPNIDDNNNANLYIVTISPSGEMSDVLLVVD